MIVIDAHVDPDFAAWERREARRPAALTSLPSRPAFKRPQGTLSKLPSHPVPPRPAEAVVEVEAVQAETVAVVPEEDSLAYHRQVRFGILAVVVIVLFFVWVWQRRRG